MATLFISCPDCRTTETAWVDDWKIVKFNINGSYLETVCAQCEQDRTDQGARSDG